MKRLSQLLIAWASASVLVLGAASVLAQGQPVRPRQPAAKQPPAKQPPAKQPPATIPAHALALRGVDTQAAARAAESLGALKDPLALDALLDALALGIAPEVSAACLQAMSRHADARAYPTIEFYLDYRDARVRAEAVRAVGTIDDPRTQGHMLAALTDSDKTVRGHAMEVIARRNMRAAIEPMLELLKKGDEATVPALAAMADPDLAKSLGEFIGEAPDLLLARALGLILARADFGPEAARVQVVRALGKVPGNEAIEELTRYIQSVPENPPRQSRREAEALVQARTSGGGKQP